MADPIRFGGMNSGLDTEAIIEAMMSTYQTKIDNQNKKLTTLTWKQEAYQSIAEKMTAFQNKYFDILKKDSYIKIYTRIQDRLDAIWLVTCVDTTQKNDVIFRKVKCDQTHFSS